VTCPCQSERPCFRNCRPPHLPERIVRAWSGKLVLGQSFTRVMLRKSLRGFAIRPRPDACVAPAKELPAGPEWIHEIKHDGFRVLAQRGADRARNNLPLAPDWAPGSDTDARRRSTDVGHPSVKLCHCELVSKDRGKLCQDQREGRNRLVSCPLHPRTTSIPPYDPRHKQDLNLSKTARLPHIRKAIAAIQSFVQTVAYSSGRG
jgi:hypothetical protein